LRSRPTSLLRFFAEAVACFLVLVALWTQVAPWLSYPAGWLAHFALETWASDWVRRVDRTPEIVTVETRIAITVPGMDRRRGTAELVVEARPARYGYGLPLFLALLIAARTKRFAVHAVAGYFVLLLPQAFALTMTLLRDIVAGSGGAARLAVAQWQVEAIAFGYQIGTLVLPTLVPIVLWLWFDRAFFAAVVVDGWLRRQSAP
jgi:hypothetical protein